MSADVPAMVRCRAADADAGPAHERLATRDASAMRPGVSFSQKKWPHGFTGTAIPHGTMFSR